MASIDLKHVTLTYTVPGSKPTVTPADALASGFFTFDSPTINANASMRITGSAGEDVSGWTLGFVQLKYIGTNHARYRGALDREGSVLVTASNKTLCRDTDLGSSEVWYDSLNSGGAAGPNGTNKLPAGTKIPAAKFLDVPAHLFDQPRRAWDASRINTLVTGSPNNFLHYAVVELLFCTILVAQEPGGKFHFLKHFYWNVIWEHMFHRNATGGVARGKVIRLQQNVQKTVHGGTPNDSKFRGKELDLTLPVSNTVSRRAPKVINATDWSQG